MIPHPFKTLAYGAALSALLAGGAMAQSQGTPAGDTVSNRITSLSYGAGTGTVNVDVNTIDPAVFVVDRKIDLALNSRQALGAEVAVDAGTTSTTLGFTLQNLGNAEQGFTLDVTRFAGDLELNLASPATATPAPGDFYILVSDTDDVTTAMPYEGPASIGNLGSGDTHFIWLVVNVPADTPEGRFDDFRVRARTTEPTSFDIITSEIRTGDLMEMNTIFADSVATSTLNNGAEIDDLAIDIPRDGADVDEGRIQVNAPVISATKSVIVVGELNTFACDDIEANPTAQNANEGAIPGACVEYTISVSNDSTTGTAATGITISDALPSEVEFASVSGITYNPTGEGEQPSDDTAPNESGGTVSATIHTLPAGSTASFRIRATIN